MRLSSGWTTVSLSDVAAWSSGGTPKAGVAEFYDGDIPWAVIGDLNDDTLTSTKTCISEAGLRHSSAKVVPAGSILVAMYGSIGKLAITGTDMATNQAIACARVNKRVLPKFLFYYLMNERTRLAAAGKGATQRNIGQQTLKNWVLKYPAETTEQHRIVGIIDEHLSRLHSASSALGTAKKRRRGLEDSVLRDSLFGHAVLGQRVPPDLSTSGTNDGLLPSLPQGWAWKRLGEIAEVVGGVTKDAKQQANPTYVEVPYLRVANVQRGRLELNRMTSIRVSPKKAADLELLFGDVLLNEGGDRDKLARGWVWEGQVDNCIHQNHVFRARVDPARMNPYFLSWTANTIGGRWAEQNGRQSVNLASISLSMIRKMPVIVPPLIDQEQAVNTLTEHVADLRKLDVAIDSATSRAAALRRAVLAAAFAGKLTGRSSDIDQIEEFAAQ